MTQADIPLPNRVFSSQTECVGSPPIHQLFRLISRATSVDDLKTSFVQMAATHFGDTRAALMLFQEISLDKRNSEIMTNPVMRYFLDHHAPVHEAIVLPDGSWSALCPWIDHAHVLLGPIVRDGELIGSLALTRGRDEAKFDETNLADMSALCVHLCAWFARWNNETSSSLENPLTPRERQIVELVAQGLTNSQIGNRLFVSGETVKAALKLVFRKTGVNSRAQLAARFRSISL